MIPLVLEVCEKTLFVHEMQQTDFTYFKILSWGWYYLYTIIDDYSRFIVHWKLCERMKAEDVHSTIHYTLKSVRLKNGQRPILSSDNGAYYISSELKSYFKSVNIKSIHGKMMHPQTQDKIERHQRSMKNVIKLDKYYHQEEMTEAIRKFVEYYNHQRHHESLQNLTPVDVSQGRQEEIIKQFELIKKQTL